MKYYMIFCISIFLWSCTTNIDKASKRILKQIDFSIQEKHKVQEHLSQLKIDELKRNAIENILLSSLSKFQKKKIIQHVFISNGVSSRKNRITKTFLEQPFHAKDKMVLIEKIYNHKNIDLNFYFSFHYIIHSELTHKDKISLSNQLLSITKIQSVKRELIQLTLKQQTKNIPLLLSHILAAKQLNRNQATIIRYFYENKIYLDQTINIVLSNPILHIPMNVLLTTPSHELKKFQTVSSIVDSSHPKIKLYKDYLALDFTNNENPYDEVNELIRRGISINKVNNYFEHNIRDLSAILEFEEIKSKPDKQKQFLIEKFNLKNPQRYSDKIFSALYNTYMCPNSQKKNALVIYNNNDYNEVWEMEANRSLEPLVKGYNLTLYEVEKDNEVFEIIKKYGLQKKVIDLLILGGHGTQKNILFGTEESLETAFIDATDIDKFKTIKPFFNYDSLIVLNACSTGKGGLYGDNIARWIKNILEMPTIFAPQYDTYIETMETDEETGELFNPIYKKYNDESVLEVF